jgi:thioredoxin 2
VRSFDGRPRQDRAQSCQQPDDPLSSAFHWTFAARNQPPKGGRRLTPVKACSGRRGLGWRLRGVRHGGRTSHRPHCGSVNRVPPGNNARAAKCGHCHNALFTGAPVAVSAQSFDRHIRYDQIPVLADFWAERCGPCHIMAPVFASAAGDLEPAVRFLKVDIESAPDIAAKYDVRSIPMLILFRNGAVVAQRAGAIDGQTLRTWLQPHIETEAAA